MPEVIEPTDDRYESERRDINYMKAKELFARGDFVQAVSEFEIACGKNNGLAQASLGYCFYGGYGCDRDFARAFELFTASHSNGCPLGTAMLSDVYKSGKGAITDAALAQSLREQSRDALVKLAEAGNDDAQYFLGTIEYYDNQNYDEAFKWLGRAAEQHHVGAERLLGNCYYYGRGTAENDREAFLWHIRAARKGNTLSQNLIGDMYRYGRGVDRNYARAEDWYHKAAARGNAQSQYSLGVLYRSDRTGMKDKEKAFAYFLKAAGSGHHKAEYMIGQCCYVGDGVERNVNEALKWMVKAIESGDRDLGEAKMATALLLMENDDVGRGIRWLTELAESGDAEACYRLGSCYYSGGHVERDLELAARWMQKAVLAEHPGAQCWMGGMYYYGDEGIDRDYEKAFSLLTSSAEKGFAGGQHMLGKCYRHGRGIGQDHEKAFEWHMKAAVQNDRYAQYDVGKCYALGLGTKKDRTLAGEWYRRAADQGVQEAVEALEKL